MTNREQKFQKRMAEHLSMVPSTEVAKNFPKYATRQTIARFAAFYEAYKMGADAKGSIIECGVHQGFSAFSWMQFCSVFEPVNYYRKIVCFDTWEGFVELAEEDESKHNNPERVKGAFGDTDLEGQKKCAELAQLNSLMYHMPRMQFVKGDFMKTGPKYIEQNKHLVVSHLYLDFDLFEPTKEALQLFVPRMSKGSVIILDELNNERWPGETEAVLQGFNLNQERLIGFTWEPNLSILQL